VRVVTLYRLIYWEEDDDEAPSLERLFYSREAALSWATAHKIEDWTIRTEVVELDDSPIPF
tara:strand:+ start:2586 stop:2768 length:183 start_codon:yes stop_codon:yes gene_type:complete